MISHQRKIGYFIFFKFLKSHLWKYGFRIITLSSVPGRWYYYCGFTTQRNLSGMRYHCYNLEVTKLRNVCNMWHHYYDLKFTNLMSLVYATITVVLNYNTSKCCKYLVHNTSFISFLNSFFRWSSHFLIELYSPPGNHNDPYDLIFYFFENSWMQEVELQKQVGELRLGSETVWM